MFLVVTAEAAASAPTLITQPVWTRKPTGEDISRVYPLPAQMKNIEGYAVLVCQVAPDGSLANCMVSEEDPYNQGFGAATINLSSKFRLQTPVNASGAPLSGGYVRIPIAFRLPGAADLLRTPEFTQAQACYGQVAALADREPTTPGAWQATVLWSVQIAAMVAKSGGRPSNAEHYIAQSRRAVEEGIFKIPADADLATCLAKGKR